MYAKIICTNERDFVINVYLSQELKYEVKLPISKIDEFKSSLSEIKLGITQHGYDTNDPNVIKQMNIHNEHIALAGLYMSKDGYIYRMFWVGGSGKREKQKMIDEFIETQQFLNKIKSEYFIEIDSNKQIYNYINNEVSKLEKQKEIDSGRISCIGEEFGCMATTNGSQYCCKTYCPFE